MTPNQVAGDISVTWNAGILRPSKDGTPPAEHPTGDTTMFTRFTTLITATLLAATVTTSAQAFLCDNGITGNAITENGITGNAITENGTRKNSLDRETLGVRMLMIELPRE
jgi:hypothetical protein